MRSFFDSQCLANCKQIWQKSTNLSLKFEVLIIGEIKRQFFAKRCAPVSHTWQTKFGKIDPSRKSYIKNF